MDGLLLVLACCWLFSGLALILLSMAETGNSTLLKILWFIYIFITISILKWKFSIYIS